MHAIPQRILELLDHPEELEALYREAPEVFRASLEEASRTAPDSVALRVWRARLEYREPGRRASWRGKLGYAIAIALACGALVRLPALWLSEDWYYPRLAPSLVILALGAYFWIERRTRRHLIAGLILALAAVGYVRLLPAYTDSVNMALIHLPVVFWAFLGLVFMGDSWRDADSRIRFLRYNGELVVLASLVALGGMVFSFVTVTLFELVSENIEERYFENVGVFGATAVPIAGTYLYDAVFGRRTGIAAVLARVFAPLFFVMAVTFLIVSFVGGQNPFIDRSFLITFNGLLLVVLGISVFSIVERAEESQVGLMDYINIALVIVTLLIDAIALSAILFRVVSFGFTPNRVVVLGANLIIIVHLGWICWTYVALARRRASLAALQRVVVGYLPVYVAWAAVVAFLLPLVFGFA
jgi:hypothetical protein